MGGKITGERQENVWPKFTTKSCLGRLEHSGNIQLHDKGVRYVQKKANGDKNRETTGQCPADV